MPAQLPPIDAASPPMLHDVTIVSRKPYSCARVEGVPPEEFGIDRNARSLRDCGYCFHEVIRREAGLIAAGYDAAQVKALPSDTAVETSESLARDTVDESRGPGDDGVNKANREIKVTEHYVRMDYEGDGKARLYRVTTGGNEGEVLRRDGEEDIVEVDVIPFAAMTPVIVTHRFFGRSVADLVMDIQRIKTALLRGALDNLYLHNNPRVEVAEAYASENTLDDLLVSRPGGIVRTKQPGGLSWQVVPDITGSVYPALQYFDAVREWRTGVSRQGQGTDPNALQNQVATIANQMFNAAQAKTKLIARIFAETGIRDLFSLLHGVIRRNGSQQQTVRLRNQWVNVDPREWRERDDMTVNVGLGTGSKDQQLAHLMAIIGLQKEALAAGKANLVSDDNLYNAAREATRLVGMKNVDAFFTDPKGQPMPQPGPDPRLIDIQLKAGIEKLQAQADIETQRKKAETEAALNQQKFAQESQQSREQHDMHMAEMRMKLAAALATQAAGHLRPNRLRPKAGFDGQEAGSGVQEPAPDGSPSQPRAGSPAEASAKAGAEADMIAKILESLSPRPRGMRIVRDAQGRVSHTEPM